MLSLLVSDSSVSRHIVRVEHDGYHASFIENEYEFAVFRVRFDEDVSLSSSGSEEEDEDEFDAGT